jgi:hypothetical protein
MQKRSSIKRLLGTTTGSTEQSDRKKDPAAVSLGRRGGLIGGRVRAERLSAPERSEIARKAAVARWKKRKLDG